MRSYCRWFGAIALLLLAACNSKQVDYLPFQESEDGYWGLIDRKGKVLFAEEFENEIINVSDGILCTTDDDGLYQYYTVEKKPRLIAGGFKDAGVFHEGLAPVAMKDEWIKFIDKKGEVAFELKEIEGKQVESVTGFHFGIAIYRLEDDTYGLIDTNGNLLTKPRHVIIDFCTTGGFYGRGFYGLFGKVIENEILVVTYSDAVLLLHYKDFINNKQDKALCKLDFDKHQTKFYMNSDYYCVSTDKKHTIMDKDKTILTIPKNSKMNMIYDIMGKYILFSNEDRDRMGVMDLKGNTVIRPKYRFLAFMDDKSLICSTNGKDFKMIDIKDNVINGDLDLHQETYGIHPLFYDGIACLRNSDGESYFLNKKGQPINNTTYSMVISSIIGGNKVNSDFFNINKLIRRLEITEYGIGGVTINTTVEEFMEYDNMNSYYEVDIDDYVREDEIDFYRYVDGVKVEFYPSFDGYIAINSLTEVEPGIYGGESNWNPVCELDKLLAGFYLTGELEERGEAIYEGLCDFFTEKSTMHVIGENKASFRFKNSKDLRLSYDEEDKTIVLIYCNFTMSDDSFNSVNE
ncbi:MAG: WG repeat-containing protein [Bacteroidaceae bacterium]|nr:WG repeat-containing protein [Bacteroidaceae bacterium]MBO5134441.1 WG repeat-containing protein [Bacteroidaceae bacterium]